MVTPQEVLDRAADILEERGWQPQPGLSSGDGPICALQAIWAAEGWVGGESRWTPEQSQSCKAAVDLAMSRITTGEKQLYLWNDHQKSIKPILEVLRG